MIAPTIAHGEELAGLLDRLHTAGVRLDVSADRRRLTYRAPSGTLTPELRAAIRTHRGELLAALTTPLTPAQSGELICAWGRPHFAYWRYHAQTERLICVKCYPNLAGECAPIRGHAEAREEGQRPRDRQREALAARRRVWIARAREELTQWGEAHEWPRLAIAHGMGAGSYAQPYKAIAAGASFWGAFLSGASGTDLAAAYRAAGLDRAPTPNGYCERYGHSWRPVAGEAHTEYCAHCGERRTHTARAASASAQDREAIASAQEGEEGEELAGAGAVMTIDDRGAYLCRGLTAPELLAYAPVDVATIAGIVRYAEAHGCANVWIDPASHLRERMAGDPAAFLSDAAAVHIRANASQGISQIYTAHVSSEARPRPHTVIITAPDPAGNNGTWKHGASAQALALAYAGEALAWPFRGVPHYVGRRLILKHNARRGWYEKPAARYASVPEIAKARPRTGTALEWRRYPSPSEEGAAYLHEYDKAACYLSMCSSVDLPIGAPSWRAGARLEKRPGQGMPAALWHVTISYAGSAYNGRELPAICGEGDVWVWTPTLRVALDMGYQVTAWHGAVMWPEQHRILNTWKQRVWGAILALRDPRRYRDAIARELASGLIKALYTQTIGMFNHDPERSHRRSPRQEAREEAQELAADYAGEDREELARWRRPEWYHLIVSEANGRMVRHIEKLRAAGILPIFAHVDGLAILSASPDPAGLLAPTGLTSDPETCGALIPEYSWPLNDAEIAAAIRSAKYQQIRGHALPPVQP